jgi:hypothetical protein
MSDISADDLEVLVDHLLCSAAIEQGYPARTIGARKSAGPAGRIVEISGKKKNLRWTDREDEFLRENLGFVTEAEIGRALGRTETAVHIHAERELHLSRPSKDPRYITTQKIGEALGVDPHKAISWFERGFFAGEKIPTERRRAQIRRVLKADFIEWALDWRNWIWFDPKNVPQPNLRRLLEIKIVEWGDEWWTTRQAADLHGVGVKDVTRFIKAGKIEAVQAPNLGGRDQAGWAFWFVRKSEATRADLHFVKHGPRKKRSDHGQE